MESFESMIKASPIINREESEKRDVEVEGAVLAVYGIVFDNRKKWEFYYEGNKIPVQLLDEDFTKNVLNRTYRFANGDRIRCTLVKHQELNKTAMVFENKSYSIKKVDGPPIRPDPQGNLDL